MAIHVEEAALNDLKTALENAGERYKANLIRLENLINQITRGDIKGDPADQLLAKFQAKEQMFKNLATVIDDAESFMGIQKSSFKDLMDKLISSMH